eukprot:COSAG04_NODE_4652_length_1967_cov_1.519272_1_plen_98_part_10
MVDKTCTGDPAECDPDTQTPHVPFTAGITGADPLQSSTLGISVYARPPSEQPTLLSDLATAQVIPTPLHVLGRISPFFPPFSPFFARFHRLDETVPTS